MPNTIEQTKSVNLFAGMLTDNKVAITGLSNPQPVPELLYYKLTLNQDYKLQGFFKLEIEFITGAVI